MMNRADIFHTKLQHGAVCLTATNRLARQIMAEYDQWMISSTQTAWNRPVVLSFESWCHKQIDLIGCSDQILNNSQSLFLWEAIIQDDITSTRHELLQVAPTARKARQADKQLQDYCASFNKAESADDHRAFLRWQKKWQQKLTENNWIDPFATIGIVTDALVSGAIESPTELFFLGFDDFNPAQLRFIESLRKAGCAVEVPDKNLVVEPLKQIYAAADARSEVAQCARWVRQILLNNVDAKIGVVAPRLENYHGLIRQLFHAELDPPGQLSAVDQPLPFNISLGSKLAEEGVVFAALQLLTLPQTLSLDEISWLLRTPYIDGARSSRSLRGRADSELRRRHIADFPLWKIKRGLKGTGCDAGFDTIIDALGEFQKIGRTAMPGVWAEQFSTLLQACGWPGDRTISSREYQSIGRFRTLLTEMASLDTVAGPISRSVAAGLLQRLARETDFQPQTSGSQVQVLGLLEAGGLQFDYLWVLGMHAGVMPQPIRPNPFIPLPLQRQLGMPHADANRELDYSLRVIDRLFNSAAKVIISWPAFEDGLENRPGLFLQTLPEASFADLPSAAPTESIFKMRPQAEKVSDELVEPLISKKPVSGGTAIVKDQALCPFRAFAHHRLKAQGLESTDIGLDNMTRGTLVHSTLEYFWHEVESHDRLCQLGDNEIARLLEVSAEKAVSREESVNKSDMPPRQRFLEVKRLTSQGIKWLELERKRAPFSVIEQEELHQETIGRLQFRTRIDRIDRLADGTLAIIDYKTGLPDPVQWFDERISEPQLPIYCQGQINAEIGAVVFAVVRTKPQECRFAGIARNPDAFPKINERRLQGLLAEKGWDSIDQVLDNWKKVLPALGDAFVSGVAPVDPVDRDKACKYCDLVRLCRIHEADLWPEWEAENG